ncbi:dethiobiotin synthase [Marinobacterium lutimaris]|uniref:ATP-dependent dethiobiotin synthetase BioD n=1 Tax=Marinobacterium lutimaris TaxID=568106 RepID=A0A1H6CF62_9GAMM|nr:dethiobiotin synthase [Marinobacterium lutimaris]SEG71659.1 dethiobiotin synthetase [Marinobacterium lutimaris]
MKKTFFITGTDTDAGKTLVSAGLLHHANELGLRTIGLKPVAAGCEDHGEGLRNSDALILQATASVQLPYQQVNPIALAEPMAPHLAAQREERRLSADRIAAFCRGALMQPADFALVEGAGGWRVPLSSREMLSRVPQLMELPVILVVGMKLGCISHALLTAEAISRDGLQLAGWVANVVDPEMAVLQENIDTLKGALHAPLLGVVPHLSDPSPEQVAAHLDLSAIEVFKK